MQGQHVYEEEPIVTIEFRAVIPPNHLTFRVAKVVDVSFIYDLTKAL
jgi:hypothetical protein